MALEKRQYIPHQIVITAENLNAIQDEIISKCVTVESKTFSTAGKKIARQNIGLPVSDDTIEEGSTVALADLSGEAVDVGNGDTIVNIDGFDISAMSVGNLREGALDTFRPTTNGAWTAVAFNDIDYPGYVYVANVSGHTNAPASSVEGVLMVMSEATMLHPDATVHNTLVTQVFFDRISNTMFVRHKYNGTWTAWVQYATQAKLKSSKVLIVTGQINSSNIIISDPAINADMVCIKAIVDPPSAQLGDWTVATNDNGQAAISPAAQISGSPTVTLYLAEKQY